MMDFGKCVCGSGYNKRALFDDNGVFLAWVCPMCAGVVHKLIKKFDLCVSSVDAQDPNE